MKGYLQVYTGDGKGKTTAAVGLAIRALGAGKRVCFLQFMKDKSYSEHKVLCGLSARLSLRTYGKPFFIAVEENIDPALLAGIEEKVTLFKKGNPPLEYVKCVQAGAVAAKQAVSGNYDLVVLDEIIMALYFELLTWQELKDIIDSKAEHTELVLTGRKAPQKLVDIADLVTEMKEIKHYYKQGIEARLGIEN